MPKKIIIPTILFVIVLIFSFGILIRDKKNNLPENTNQKERQIIENQIILFYGDGCPHCAIVENFIAENKVKEKIPFEEKEVYYNQQNSEELAGKAKECDIPTNSIGVPFLWDGSTCLVGDQDIINFLKQKIINE